MQVIERWILARLRHHTFFSLAELNHCVKALLQEVNARPFKQFSGNRREWFEQLDKPALGHLPREAYQYTDIKQVKLNIDYHVQYDAHLYSAPHHLVGEMLELHATDSLSAQCHQQRAQRQILPALAPAAGAESVHRPPLVRSSTRYSRHRAPADLAFVDNEQCGGSGCGRAC